MYTLYLIGIIGVIIGLVIGSCVPCGEQYDTFGRTGCRITGVLTGAIFGLLIGGFIANVIMPGRVPHHQVISPTIPLAAMRSSDGFSGAFVWGSGTVSSEEYYNFIYRNDDGSFTPGRVPADSTVRIIEDPALHNQGSWYEVTDEPDQSSPVAAWALPDRSSATVVQEVFHVPAGTLVQAFQVK